MTAARSALEQDDVDLILPFVPAAGEDEVRSAFERTARARQADGDAAEVANRWFFETVVRIHRAGEGAPFTGLKPAGLDVSPVIPVAERALETGSPDELADLLCRAVRHQVEHRLAHAMALRPAPGAGVAETRAWVEATLGLQVWAHGVHRQLHADPHEHGGTHEHE